MRSDFGLAEEQADVTLLLRAWSDGDDGAREALIPFGVRTLAGNGTPLPAG